MEPQPRGYDFKEMAASRGFCRWSGVRSDFDAVRCTHLGGMPLMPLEALHVFDRDDSRCKVVPIRMSRGLVMRAYLRRWLWALVVFAGSFVLTGVLKATGASTGPGVRPTWGVVVAGVAAGFVAVALLGQWMLRRSDRRNRQIRRVLGRHGLGNSDPADWTDVDFAAHPPPEAAAGATGWVKQGRASLQERNYSAAMMAARLAVRSGDVVEGERLTDDILADGLVRHSVGQCDRAPALWWKLMRGDRKIKPEPSPVAEE